AAVLTSEQIISAELIAPWLYAQVMKPVIPTTTMKASSMIEVHDEGFTGVSDIPKIICNGDQTLEDVERETIVATLKSNNGHRQKSAKALGIGVRTLGLKLKKWKEMELVSPTL
ncbi:MAG: hypothetical protein O7G85_11335, partial [Planctomycetota bacterium]|nr:hypothetical protein [Planctomycetota bacterium]